MDSPFTYNTYVTGTDFISRHQELDLFTNLVRQKQHILIYEPPKSGKHSLIQQGLIKLRQEGYGYTVCKINLFNVRTQKHLLYKVFDSLLETFCSSPQEREEVIAEINSGIAGVFGEGEVKYETATDPIPDAIAEQILNMPEFMANKYNTNPVIYLEEFQELLLLDDNYYVLKLLEKILQSHTASTYIITGSQVNAMKEIFEVQRFFYNFAERIKLGRIDKKSFTDFIIRSFLKAGRVVSKELADKTYELTDGHPWYTQQLGDISFLLTRGFLTDQILMQSFTSLIELHSYRFLTVTGRLSRFQINFLKAILDDAEKLSSAEVMLRYGFNSSANVNRLKEALQKKEILTQEKGKWEFLDPLFKTWLKNVYFEL